MGVFHSIKGAYHSRGIKDWGVWLTLVLKDDRMDWDEGSRTPTVARRVFTSENVRKIIDAKLLVPDPVWEMESTFMVCPGLTDQQFLDAVLVMFSS
jgi:hypothetical protein